jgi:hypothetical protein
MKYCPSCQISYADDSLQFCLEDGTGLLNYSNKTSEMPTQFLPPAETKGQIKPLPTWEQSQITRIATTQSEKKKSNTVTAVILTALVICGIFAGIVGVWFLINADNSEDKGSSNINTNNTYASPSPTPTFGKTSSNKNTSEQIPIQNTNSGEIQKKATPKGGGLGGESFKACDFFLGSGLYDKWRQMGGEKGRLGCPIINEADTPPSPKGTTGRYTQFSKGDGGYIIWHGSGRFKGISFEVSGCMFKLYYGLGGTGSWLGFPVKDGYQISTGARQDFEEGYILWDSKTYQCQAFKN